MAEDRVRRCAALAGAAALALGCATTSGSPTTGWRMRTRHEANAPLGGEALSQRRLDLERSLPRPRTLHRDDRRAAPARRQERARDVQRVRGFYVSKHVIRCSSPNGRAAPEIAQRDANARLAVASLWAKLGATSSASRMLDDIERASRAAARWSVGYPIGSESTLRDAVKRLRSRSGWSG
jgi:hypothetical protein